MDALVSVIIPAYNAAATIARSLASVFRQEVHFEIIVVDDGSQDETGTILQRDYGRCLRYFRQDNAGPAAARNSGIREARGKYIAFLDADDEWMPRKLALQLARLEHLPECALCFSDMSHWEGECEVHVSYLKERHFRHVASGAIYTNLLSECFVFTPTVLVRRSVLEEVGVFDEGLRIAEDYDLWLRIARRFPVVFLDEPLLRRYRTGFNISNDHMLYIDCHLRLFQRLLEQPETSWEEAILIRQRLFELHMNAGYHLRKKNLIAEAREHYLASLRLRGSRAAFTGLFACLVSAGLNCIRFNSSCEGQ